jgi:hypothetical protein
MVMAGFTDTRQGSGFPDWEIVRGSGRLFDWYNPERVSELSFVHDGRSVRLAVSDCDRRVIRSAGLAGDPSWLIAGAPVDLATVPGLVRRNYGRGSGGHTEYFVARS